MNVAFIGQYLNAPAGDEPFSNDDLKEVISRIGKKYGSGKGSPVAKGRMYLKKQIQGCSSNHIKLMLDSASVFMRGKNDDAFWFRFSINSYVKVFAKIVEIMTNDHECFSDLITNAIPLISKIGVPPKFTYSELLIHEPFISLNIVYMEGITEEHRKKALTIKEGIEGADKKYK
jgi:hypothetical protein